MILLFLALLIWPVTTNLLFYSNGHTFTLYGKSNSYRSATTTPKTRWLYNGDNKISTAITLGDINNDGYTEIIFGNDGGYLYVLNSEGKIVWYDKIDGSVKTTPALLDINNDGYLDVIFGTSRGYVYTLNGNNGTTIWKRYVGGVIRGSCGVSDINNDGTPEIVVTASVLGNNLYNGEVYALSSKNGTVLWSSSIATGISGSFAIGDINNDNIPEVVVGDKNYSLFILSGKNGSRIELFSDIISYGTSPVIGDLDGDGHLDIVIVNEFRGVIAIDARTKKIKWETKLGDKPEAVSPTLVDLDGDGYLDVIVGGHDEKVYALSGADGSEKWIYQVDDVLASPAAIGDIDGDNKLDVVVCSGKSVYAIDGEKGTLLWKYLINSYLQVPPAVYDINNDGNLEVIYGFSSIVGVLGYNSSETTGTRVFWPTFGGTSSNTRNIEDIDPDRDGLSTYSENIFKTNPYNKDTNGDGMPDGWEIMYGLNPIDNTDANTDLDGDGISNLNEYKAHTNPLSSDTDHDFIPDSIDFFPTNWWLPMVPIYVFAPIAVGSWSLITTSSKKKKRIAEVTDKCLKVFSEKGIVYCQEMAKDLSKKSLKKVVSAIIDFDSDVVILEDSLIVKKAKFDAIKAKLEELTSARPWGKYDLVNALQNELGYDKGVIEKLVEHLCSEECFALSELKYCTKELAHSLIKEIEKLGIITPAKVTEKFPFLTTSDARILIEEGIKKSLILPSKTTLDIWYGKSFISGIMSKIKKRISASSEMIIPLSELIQNVSEIPPRDLSYYFYTYLVREAEVIPRLEGTAVYTHNYLIQEINKRFDVFAEIQISQLARELNVDIGVLRNVIIKLIEEGRLNARIRGDTLISLLTLLATSEPQTPAQSQQVPMISASETVSASETTMPTITIPGYRLLEVIGSGGFATVFKAVDSLNREVALKVIPTTDINSKKIFAREILVWKPLTHPNIVKLYDFGIEPIPFMALELMDGSLRHKMVSQKITLRESIEIIKQIASALVYAHKDFNLIHRDIKPENILYKGNTYKLSDWTLSIIQGLIRKDSGYSGTIIYSAPEQFDKSFGEIGPWTDIWQLGTVFYELLSGQPPFGSNPTEAIEKILRSPPTLISNVPSEVWNIVFKMLQKDYRLRPTALEVIKRLGEL